MSGEVAYGDTNHTPVSTQEPIVPVALPKKLIVCCDGTWMDSDNGYVKGSWGRPGHMQNPTNVTRIARAITPEDDAHHPQVVYYQAGVGTGIGLWSRLAGGGAGIGLSEHIREAYSFLVNNYREKDPTSTIAAPDSIFLIGFSRGAFTARSIGGLIGAVGLLKKKVMPYFYQIFSDWENAGNYDYTPQFFDAYRELHPETVDAKPDSKLAKDHKSISKYMKAYFNALLTLDLTQSVIINCIGVWDTVGSLGIPVNPLLQKIVPFSRAYLKDYSWFDTRVGENVNNAFQALALDEHRYPFSPTLWEKSPSARTQLKQVWFPGAHSNVGGSYPDTGIADITLAWMMDQLSGSTTKHLDGFKHCEWIKFDEDYRDLDERMKPTAEQREKHAPYHGWGMGYVYESMYFPQSMLGKRVRGPGCYRRIDFETGKPTDKILEGTNEYIHSCVRARVDMGGRATENDWAQLFPHGINFYPNLSYRCKSLLGQKPRVYQPTTKSEPLCEWRLIDNSDSKGTPTTNGNLDSEDSREVVWEYRGMGPVSSRTMKEDKMGPFELKLMQKDDHLAGKVTYSNNKWRWRK